MMYFEDEKHSCYKWKSGKAENLGIAYGVGYEGLPASQRWAVWLATIGLKLAAGRRNGKMKIIRKKVLKNLVVSKNIRNFATKLQN